jgi:S-adenosylmethionine decarboxylase proenzyme
MDTFGRHWLAEYHGCDLELLNDEPAVKALLERAARAAGATVVASVFHRFAPQGVSGVVVIEESHLSIHTWPETGYAAVDFYTCGDCIPSRAHQVLAAGLGADASEVLAVERGLGDGDPGQPSIRIEAHRREDGPMTESAAAAPSSPGPGLPPPAVAPGDR